jgi:hypothetical protein
VARMAARRRSIPILPAGKISGDRTGNPCAQSIASNVLNWLICDLHDPRQPVRDSPSKRKCEAPVLKHRL